MAEGQVSLTDFTRETGLNFPLVMIGIEEKSDKGAVTVTFGDVVYFLHYTHWLADSLSFDLVKRTSWSTGGKLSVAFLKMSTIACAREMD